MKSRQSRMRERRKADGGKSLSVILTPSGYEALGEYRKIFPELTLDKLVSAALVAAVYLYKRQLP